ncbi:MAG: 2-oxoacid:acceptor oxidoreductase subunit alpha [Rhodoferax sp.]|uniref:2-oxoacid:acceptor oxidoreductase subunit alpha n=1 Tax=Rhodoferax sp. TaxID=50421 RepID=UPI00261C18A0|nr:2-oxoacid:acceptor oxidoreductase subunit alpha [Rhodoferax sp.]MDD5335364.1 2-oxoacid:acceptor oxidoreductase subunit alpha [Rhodoferax sp.]
MTVPTSVSIALAGSGGSGVMTAGTVLLAAAAKAGAYGLMVRTSGPQIRGGEAAALLRLGPQPMGSLDDGFDLLLAIDWQNVNRFADEIVLGPRSVLIGDPDEGEAPEVFKATGARYAPLSLKKMAKAIPGSWVNMIALGLSGTLAGLPLQVLQEAVRESWKKPATLEANLLAVAAGAEAAAGIAATLAHSGGPMAQLELGALQSRPRWMISGNEATGFGALRGGVRFVAAYPITPATEVLEWLAPKLPEVGGTLLQAEDELASINMIIGASYGGVPSLTATAGPGLALMTEALGLAVASEVPIVVVDVMRGGPSTGIPAKSEQSDLSFAVGGLPGDAPRLVVAPSSIGDCLGAAQWTVHLAEALQAPAILLSDQFMGQSRAVIDRPLDSGFAARRLTAEANTPDYKRYRNTESGVSPMAIPGTEGVTYTADGLEHSEAGIPSSQSKDHVLQLDKRQRKLALHDYGPYWADIEGDADAVVITFGSASGPVREAVARARALGTDLRLIVLRLLAPTRPEQMAAALQGVKRSIVVEQNHGAQLYRYLRAWYDFPAPPASYHRSGPLPLRPAELLTALLAWRNAK